MYACHLSTCRSELSQGWKGLRALCLIFKSETGKEFRIVCWGFGKIQLVQVGESILSRETYHHPPHTRALAIEASSLSARLALILEAFLELGYPCISDLLNLRIMLWQLTGAFRFSQDRAETSARCYCIRCDFGERLALCMLALEDLSLAEERLMCVVLQHLVERLVCILFHGVCCILIHRVLECAKCRGQIQIM
jgi:hypothetical protein